MTKNIVFTIICIVLNAVFIYAQAEPNPAPQRTEMKKLKQMAGQWKGSGWIMRGPTRETFAGTETVQRKLDGLALLVEGRFTNEQGVVVHETLAVLSYDSEKKDYRFSTYLANGTTGEQALKLIEGGWQWGIQFPGGAIRYTTKMSNEEWLEIGEMSKDNQTWNKFFEMKLQRVK